eukprot:941222-Amphidinium_carterae.2
MTSLSEHTGDTFSAYFCVVLFDSLGYELHAQDIQETRGAGGLGVHCTLDLEKAQAVAQTTGKQILIAEFSPTPRLPTRAGANGLLLVAPEVGDESKFPCSQPATNTMKISSNRQREGA